MPEIFCEIFRLWLLVVSYFYEAKLGFASSHEPGNERHTCPTKDIEHLILSLLY